MIKLDRFVVSIIITIGLLLSGILYLIATENQEEKEFLKNIIAEKQSHCDKILEALLKVPEIKSGGPEFPYEIDLDHCNEELVQLKKEYA